MAGEAKSLAEGLGEFYAAQAEAAPSERACNLSKPWARPMRNEALAVHPRQRAQATERNRKAGVPVTYDAQGMAIIPDRRAYRALLKLEGRVLLNSYTGY
jgi:hypothetical protein